MNEAHPLYSSFIINIVFNAFSAYSAIMLNILTIHAIRKTPSLPKPLKTLLLSLAVSDLGVGLLVQPLFIVWMVNPIYNSTTKAGIIIGNTFANVSFLTVVAISVDRFLAIHLHLRYQELVTHKPVVAVVISIWVLSASLTLISQLDSLHTGDVVISIILGLCFICTAIIYCIIYLAVRRHTNQIQVLQARVAHNSEMTNFATQTKSAISTFYVYLVFLIFCLPEYCVAVVRLFRSEPNTSLDGVWLYSLTLLYLNSSLNPVIYCWKMRHIRQSIIDILQSLLPTQN